MPFQPSQPITVPSAIETRLKIRCTTKNACGRWPVKDRGSSATFLMNVTQMTHENTPKATRKIDQRLVSSIFRACHRTAGVPAAPVRDLGRHLPVDAGISAREVVGRGVQRDVTPLMAGDGAQPI